METFKEIISKTIVKSLEQNFLDIKYGLNLDSQNYLGQMKADVINTNLIEEFDSDRYIIHKFNRFAWEGRFIIDLKAKMIVSITSISNLNRVPNVRGRRIPHYMQTLVQCLNEGIKSDQQVLFDGFAEFESDVYENELNKMLSDLDIELDEYTYYVVAYNFKANQVTDINWYLLTADFNIAEEESIMDLVKPDIGDLTVTVDGFNEVDASPDEESLPKKGIKLGLKEKKLKKEG